MFSSWASVLIRKVPSARFLYCKQMISDLTSRDESQIFFRQQGSSIPCLFDITEVFCWWHFCMLSALMWKGLVKVYRNICFFRIRSQVSHWSAWPMWEVEMVLNPREVLWALWTEVLWLIQESAFLPVGQLRGNTRVHNVLGLDQHLPLNAKWQLGGVLWYQSFLIIHQPDWNS